MDVTPTHIEMLEGTVPPSPQDMQINDADATALFNPCGLAVGADGETLAEYRRLTARTLAIVPCHLTHVISLDSSQVAST